MSDRIAAYITSYNDEVTLIRCIKSILNQTFKLSSIFIVDNSRIPIQNLESLGNHIIVKHYSQNIGISGGLSIVFDWAIQNNFDFLWLFDQDSNPQSDCLEHLRNNYYRLENRGYTAGIIAPLVKDPRSKLIINAAYFTGTHFIPDENISNTQLPYECDAPITSGSLISVKGIRESKTYLSDLFIDGIDWELGMHLKEKGYSNFIIPWAVLEHEFGTPRQIIKEKRIVIVQLYSTLRHYYMSRNHTHLELKYSKGLSKLKCLIFRMKYVFQTFQMIVAYDPDEKTKKMWACIIGTWHGIIGHLGKVY